LESDWRLRVFLLSLYPLPLRLCARINSGIHAGLWMTDWKIGTNHQTIFATTGTSFGLLGPTLSPISTNPNFPYGWPVDPD